MATSRKKSAKQTRNPRTSSKRRNISRVRRSVGDEKQAVRQSFEQLIKKAYGGSGKSALRSELPSTAPSTPLPIVHGKLVEYSARQYELFSGAVDEQLALRSTDDSASVDKIVKGAIKLATDTVKNLKIVLTETTAEYYWWGANVKLTPAASTAMQALVDPNVLAVLGAMALSRTAGIVLIVLKGLGAQISADLKASTTAKGARITVYFYLFPVVED